MALRAAGVVSRVPGMSLQQRRSFGARHPCRFFTRLPVNESLPLAWPGESSHCAAGAAQTAQLARRAQGRMPGVKKVTKGKVTTHSRLPHSSCAPGPRACYGVRRQSIPGLASNWPTSCGPSFGHFLRRLAATEGALVARIVCARATVKAKAKTPLILRHPLPRGEKEKNSEMPMRARICFGAARLCSALFGSALALLRLCFGTAAQDVQ